MVISQLRRPMGSGARTELHLAQSFDPLDVPYGASEMCCSARSCGDRETALMRRSDEVMSND